MFILIHNQQHFSMAKYNKLINTKQIFIHFFLKNNLSEKKNNHIFGITNFFKNKT